MIYLDNSSTTHKKPYSVKKESQKGLKSLSVNPSRGGYKLAIKGSQKIFQCREELSEYLGCDSDKVIFTSGCTMALNLAINGTAKKNGHIITTIYEHNSVLRVLEKLKQTHNISYTTLTPNKDGLINLHDISRNIKENTYIVIINHTSNVTGITQNIEEIGKICKKNNLMFLVDGAQSIGHEYINIKKFNINMLSLAGHKGLYAPQGIGALLVNNTTISPLIYGGTGTYSNSLEQPLDIPDGFESGTPNIVGILGLLAGIKFVRKHQTKINHKIEKLSKYLIENLKLIPNIKLYSKNTHSGVISFTFTNIDSVEVSSKLSEKYNICTRSGLHCAPLVHKYYDTTQNGMTRISLSYYNNLFQVKKLIKAIKTISQEI